ncbi:predicted protein [Postia placenta Mad-698-R]|nr:predicted protein [Postia placenta Mad-698-R]
MPEPKHKTPDAPPAARAVPRGPSQAASGSLGTLRHIALVLAVSALAGLATYFSRTRAHTRAVKTLPESYALCADSGKIYTVDQEKPSVDCVLVRRDRISSTGSLDQIQEAWDVYQTELIHKFYGGEAKAKKPLKVVHAPKGSIVVPGLADAHAHLMMYGAKMQLNLEAAKTINDVLDSIEEYVNSHPDVLADPERWIEGFGWDQTRWENWKGGFPSKADIESRPLLSNRPLALSRVDGHALWVSSRALDIAQAKIPGGEWPAPGDVEGGEIVRDASGDPTGVLLDTAMALIPLPPPTPQLMREHAERAMKDALAVGLTSVHDAAVNSEMIKVFKSLADGGQMPIRVYAMGNEEEPKYWGGRFEKLEDYGKDGRLNMKSIKLFTDGKLSEAALKETVSRFWDDDWGVNIHCIGDRANKAVLDIFEALLHNDTKVADKRRPRIEHAQIMRMEDLERAGRLGVPAVHHLTLLRDSTSDMWYAESRLGVDRIKGAYAYRTLLRSSQKAVLPLGSDFPVEGINPLLGFYAAVSRLDARGESPHGEGGWFPAERLTRSEALKGMTLDAAYASFAEEDVGSLVPGKKADYVVLDTDIMDDSVPFADILGAKIKTTVIDGRIAYGAI